MSHKEQICNLAKVCGETERKIIEGMIDNAADYVQIVVKMETAAANIAGRESGDFRDNVAELDKSRSHIHDSLISRVDTVNRICGMHDLPPIYSGDEQRRHYGDFAIELVSDIFNARG